jgi:branched-chain amino acid transport system permease protein
VTRYALVAAGAAVLLALPSFVSEFQVSLLTQAVAWAVLALSVWLLLHYCNLPSFGHAAFFGVGAYAAGLAVTHWHVENVFVALGLAIGISVLVALPIAVVAARLGPISFLLVTLAYASMLHALAGRWKETGGSDGLVGVIRPNAQPFPFDLFDPTNYYYFSALVLVVATALVVTIGASPFGGVLLGIRESANRMAALGYHTAAYRTAAFVVSAGIAGAGGLVSAYATSFVDPSDADALVSARGLLYAVVGGGTVLGPPVAAIALTELEHVFSSWTSHWLGLLGLVYVLVALVPRGRVGLPLRRLRDAFARRPRPTVAQEQP